MKYLTSTLAESGHFPLRIPRFQIAPPRQKQQMFHLNAVPDLNDLPITQQVLIYGHDLNGINFERTKEASIAAINMMMPFVYLVGLDPGIALQPDAQMLWELDASINGEFNFQGSAHVPDQYLYLRTAGQMLSAGLVFNSGAKVIAYHCQQLTFPNEFQHGTASL